MSTYASKKSSRGRRSSGGLNYKEIYEIEQFHKKSYHWSYLLNFSGICFLFKIHLHLYQDF